MLPGKNPRPWKLVILSTKAPSGERCGPMDCPQEVVSGAETEYGDEIGNEGPPWLVAMPCQEVQEGGEQRLQ
jgi:hypothetical protein